MSNLFQLGDFTLASGKQSKWKIDCEALKVSDYEALAFMLNERLHPFSYVYGVPRGGELLAEHMKKYRTHDATRALVVDDVWTTGGTMMSYIRKMSGSEIAGWFPQKAVIFARHPTPLDVTALFTMEIP